MTVVHPPPTDPVDPGLLSHALEIAGRLANDAAEVIAATAEQRGQAVRGVRWASSSRETALFDWVTDINRTLERHTRRVLAAQFPDIPVVGPVMSARDPHRDRGNPEKSAAPAQPAREARFEGGGKTALFITHDVPEAVFLADRVLVFSSSPGHLVESVAIDLPRPRDREVKRSPEFAELSDRLLDLVMRQSGLRTGQAAS